ncbi:Guanine nucleotide-binding protein-like 3 [Vanrija pseudolonga]|uniref:Guanine nucleotide-binding protein-like 3 n=1 Tax=Vanrija pseudolonga TaxID=143232 RepID=A0AAF1BK06_9TREE|nr:Guanine nucleotide-binding protein-like 3 [Vanrija pseudolonga]
MPRIRKKTSNRQNTRDRAKINKKVAEHKKKTKRDGKKNQTWKSKKKPDLGVPNSFHLKDQVLAEMSAEKRKAQEEREARRQAARKGHVEEEEDTPGISSVAGSSVLPRAGLSATASVAVSNGDDDVPELLDSDLPTLQAALDAADVLLEVVDARDILGGRSLKVEELVTDAGSKVLLVVNKIDLVPREALQAWIAHLNLPTYLFSSKAELGKEQLLSGLSALLTEKRKGKGKKEETLTVALLGLPNVGKTSVLNTLLGREQFKTAPTVPTAAQAKTPTPTTLHPIEVDVSLPGGQTVRVIDTPGWEFVEEDDEDEDEGDDEEDEDEDEDDEKWDLLEARVAGDLLRRNLGRVDRVKDVFPLVNYILSRSNDQDLMLKYNVPYFEAGNIEAFLTGLARVNQRVKKFGDPDHEGAARIILRDWAHNTFPYYSTAPSGEAMDVEFSRPDMSAVLEQCKTRKELKTAAGIVRFQASEPDSRDVFLDDDYTAIPQPESDEDDEDEDELDFGEEDELDDDEDDEDEEDEGVFIGAEDGEELDLEDGPEPSSGSDVEDEEDESESESEPVPVRAGKRKAAPASPVDTRKKAKTVSFKAKLEAPRTVPSKGEKEVRPILKRKSRGDSEEPEVEQPKGRKARLEKKEEAPVKAKKEEPKKAEKKAAEPKPKAEKAKAAPKAAPKAAAPAPKKEKKAKGKAAANGGAEAYDFSKHF